MNQNIKATILDILLKLNNFYTFLNQELLFGWRKILSKQSDNKITNFFKTLIENPATALFLNTILFWIISSFLAGQAGIIGAFFNWLAFLNIAVFLINILGWTDKLKK